MKEQIEELQVDLMQSIVRSTDNGKIRLGDTARNLYRKGYRKQSEGVTDTNVGGKSDLVEVVRCKDCFWWNEGKIDPITNYHYGYCERPLGEYCECDSTFGTTSNDFCSYGERK